MSATLYVSFPIFATLICIGLTTAILGSRQLRERLPYFLLAYLLVGTLWNISLSWTPDKRPVTMQWLTVGSTVAMGILFWGLITSGQGRAKNLKQWAIMGGVLVLALPSLAFVMESADLDRSSPLQTWTFQTLVSVVWLTFAIGGLIGADHLPAALREKSARNWLVAFVSTGIGILSVSSAWPLVGLFAPMWFALGAMTTTLAALTPHLTDARSILRHVSVYVVVTLFSAIVLISTILIGQTFFKGSTILLVVAIASGMLGMIYQLLNRVVRGTIDRLLPGSAVDYAKHLQIYNRRIRNVLDTEQLAETIMFVIRDALNIERGLLLVGDTDDDIGNVSFQVIGNSDAKAKSVELRAFSPFMDDLRRKGLTLTQEAMDTDPRFQALRAQERDWLKSLGMQCFVPIRAHGQLVGILALDKKEKGGAYRAEDVEFLTELADRSGSTLENARLFSHMRTLNAVLNRLYNDLDVVNQRLQEMDRLKSAFISVVTHELRSPLVGIDFSLQLLQRQEQDKLALEQQEAVRDIVNGFEQLKGKIDKLVNFAAFLSKQGELRKEEIDFAAVLREATQPLEVMAQFRRIKIELQVPDQLPHVWADKERISEAIYHLVHNAIKFNRPQGHITISCAADQDVISLQVMDTGIGIDSAKLQVIWDGFSQAADPLRRGVEGLGLGLALVKYVVNAHGGEVWASSHPDQGSTFGFRIPLGQPTTPTESEMSLVVSGREESWGR